MFVPWTFLNHIRAIQGVKDKFITRMNKNVPVLKTPIFCYSTWLISTVCLTNNTRRCIMYKRKKNSSISEESMFPCFYNDTILTQTSMKRQVNNYSTQKNAECWQLNQKLIKLNLLKGKPLRIDKRSINAVFGNELRMSSDLYHRPVCAHRDLVRRLHCAQSVRYHQRRPTLQQQITPPISWGAFFSPKSLVRIWREEFLAMLGCKPVIGTTQKVIYKYMRWVVWIWSVRRGGREKPSWVDRERLVRAAHSHYLTHSWPATSKEEFNIECHHCVEGIWKTIKGGVKWWCIYTSSKIKIGAFFNNALAIAILCE